MYLPFKPASPRIFPAMSASTVKGAGAGAASEGARLIRIRHTPSSSRVWGMRKF